jgi:hypothetical protein
MAEAGIFVGWYCLTTSAEKISAYPQRSAQLNVYFYSIEFSTATSTSVVVQYVGGSTKGTHRPTEKN